MVCPFLAYDVQAVQLRSTPAKCQSWWPANAHVQKQLFPRNSVAKTVEDVTSCHGIMDMGMSMGSSVILEIGRG